MGAESTEHTAKATARAEDGWHDPNDAYDTPFIAGLHLLVGRKAHCWLGLALHGLRIAWLCVRLWARRLLLGAKSNDEYEGLTGFMAFHMKWIYGPVADCFNRPIVGSPGKVIEVARRTRKVDDDGIKVTLRLAEGAEPQKCYNLGSYNYLGYGGVFPGITERVIERLHASGIALGTTPAELGVCPEQRKAEQMIAQFLGKEDAMSVPMGFATNSHVIPTIAGSDGLVVSDELNHASIVTGIRTSGSTVRVFRHNDVAHLEAILRRATSAEERGRWSRILIVVEGLYSMEGEVCPLREIVALKAKYGAMLFVDEAHSIGAVGPTGRGVCEYHGVDTRHVDVLMGTFTKSFSAVGGYVAASARVVSYLREHCPASITGASMSPPCAQQVVSVLEHLQSAEGQRLIRQLRENSILFRRRLTEAGCLLLGPADIPVVPMLISHLAKMISCSRQLLRRGVASVIVAYPATPFTGMRARFCITGAMTAAEVEECAAHVVDVARRLRIVFRSPAEVAQSLAEADKLLAGPQLCDTPFAVPEPVTDYRSAPIVPGTYVERPARVLPEQPAGCTSLSSSDFLGIANSAAAVAAAEKTIARYGCGSCGPRGFYGTTDKHLELEARLAAFTGTEAAIAYSFGALVSTSVIPPYTNEPTDVVFYDQLCNYSIQLGIRLCKARVFEYRHCDAAALERLLATVCKGNSFTKGRRIVITEGMFASNGDIVPLPEIVRLKEKYGFTLIVDESLSLGTLGKTGRGVRELWAERTGDASLMQSIDLLVGSLENSLGSIGGFCCGSKKNVQYQVLAGAGYVFSASAPPYLCSAAVAGIDALDGEAAAAPEELKERVASVRALVTKHLGEYYDITGNDSESPLMMLSLRQRDANACNARSDALECVCSQLRDERIAASVARFVKGDRSAPKQQALRLCVSARYSVQEYERALTSLADITSKVLSCDSVACQ
eukprot:m51a1_g2353 putative serine C-palmitoyltransferase (952) ;mRNA; f:595168-598511